MLTPEPLGVPWRTVTGFACLALLYALLIPRWIPADELAHFYYVGHLVDPGRYPLPASRHLDYELRVQPPLAYLVYAPFLKLVAGLSLAEQLLCLRTVSVAIGAVTVYVNMRLLALLFGDGPDRRLLVATAGAIVAFNPAFLAVSSTVTNDGLLDLLGAAITLQAVRLVRASAPARRGGLLLCVLIGLACEAKPLALALLPLPLLVWWLRYRRYGQENGAAWRLIMNTAIMVALTAPPYLVKLAVYWDPFGMVYFHTFIHYRPPTFKQIRAGPAQVLESFWLFTGFLRGWLMVRPATADYVPFALLSLAPSFLFWRQARDTARFGCGSEQLIGLAAIALTVVAFLIKDVVDFYATSGRYLFMAIGPIAWLITAGIHAGARRIGDRRHILLWLVLIYMVLYSIVAALRYLPSALDPFRAFSF